MWRNLHKGMITTMNNNEVTANSKMEPADSTSKPVTVEKLDIKSMRDYLPMYLDAILSGAREPAISTGFAGLDIALGGGLYPGLYIMGAISSLGKTTLACQIADQIAAAGQPVLIFSLEMARKEIFVKSISRLSAICKMIGESEDTLTARDLLSVSTISADTHALIKSLFEAYGRISNNIYVHEGVGDINVKTIRAIVEAFAKKHQKTPVAIIDYIQILAPYQSKTVTDKQNMDKSVLELKRRARDLNAVIIGVSSLNRMSYNDAITMSAFKESGAIEYSADVLIGLQLAGVGGDKFNVEQAKQENPRKIEVKVLKNRNGPVVPSYLMYYYPADNLFVDVLEKPNALLLAQLFDPLQQQELPF